MCFLKHLLGCLPLGDLTIAQLSLEFLGVLLSDPYHYWAVGTSRAENEES